MFQLAMVISARAKQESDNLKQPFNLLWIFWPPIEARILKCVEGQRESKAASKEGEESETPSVKQISAKCTGVRQPKASSFLLFWN